MTRCSKCNRITTEPFATRPKCVCGSVCWYEGTHPEWPPIGAVAFLYGLSIPEMHWLPSEKDSPSAHRRGTVKVTRPEAETIRRLIAGGQDWRAIVKRYGISKSQVYRIHRRESWR